MTIEAVAHPIAPAVPLPAPDVVAAVRANLGAVRRPGRPGEVVDRLDLLAAALDPRLATLVVRWLSAERRGSTATRRAYCDDILGWAGWAAAHGLGPLSLATLDRDHITTWLLERRAQGRAPATIARRLTALASLYRYARSWQPDLACPVIDDDHRPRVEAGRKPTSARVLDPAQVAALYGATRDARDALVVALLVTDGLRVSEACAADDTDIDRDGHRAYLWVTRKGGRRARVVLDPETLRQLDRYLTGRPDPNPDDPTAACALLLDSRARRLDRRDITRMLARIARAAAIPEPQTVTPHALRASAVTHTAITRSVLDAQAFAGHADIRTTMAYVERADADDRNAAITADLAAVLRSGLANQTADRPAHLR